MIDLKSMNLEEITDLFKSMGEQAFRGKQVFTWLHKGVTSFDEMSNLSKNLREKLKDTCFITAPQVARKQVSKQDGTIKYLWELQDGNCIETVLMSYHHGNTVCISSQVGCRMGCKFCASTVAGKVRDLRPSEMLDQVLFTQLDSGKTISNIVLMGIGEPLDNRETVLRFLELVNHPEGLNIGMRHISLSTCGIVPGIDALADAVQGLIDLVGGDYMRNAPTVIGMGQYPGGADLYARQVETYISQSLPPEEIHARGYKALADTEAQMLAIARQLGFEGTLKEFSNQVQNDPQFRFSTPEEMQETMTAYLDKIRPIMPKPDL